MSSPQSTRQKKHEFDRHSSTGRRGDPKKGGAGGRGTWGKPGDELNAPTTLGPDDPNYDPDEQEPYVVQTVVTEQDENKSPLTAEAYKDKVIGITNEYLASNDVDEAVEGIVQLGAAHFHHELVKKVITLALESPKENDRELCYFLLSVCCSRHVISPECMLKGFERLQDQLDDLSLDIPNAKSMFLQFVERAHRENLLPPSFAEAVKNPSAFAEFKSKLQGVLEEYLASNDTDEVARSLRELNAPHFHYEVVKRAISLALDRNLRDKENTSVLLSTLYCSVISPDQMAKGFERLLERTEDLSVDLPNAPDVLAQFLARAVVDEIIPPSFLDRVTNLKPNDKGREVLHKAKALLSVDRSASLLQRVWGPGDGRPVEELKNNVDQLVEEYLECGDLSEAIRCVRELESPFFHHEVVKRAIIMSLERKDSHRALVLSLLKELAKENIIHPTQMKYGFLRVHQRIGDLALDLPNAGSLFQAFVREAKQQDILPGDFNFDHVQQQQQQQHTVPNSH